MGNNPKYFRLMDGDNLIGFQRIIVEYMPAESEKWQLERIECDEVFPLAQPPYGIAKAKRPLLGNKEPEQKKEAEEC